MDLILGAALLLVAQRGNIGHVETVFAVAANHARCNDHVAMLGEAHANFMVGGAMLRFGETADLLRCVVNTVLGQDCRKRSFAMGPNKNGVHPYIVERGIEDS